MKKGKDSMSGQQHGPSAFRPVCDPEELPSIQDHYRRNTTGTVPDVLLMSSPEDVGLDDIPVSRYTSREYHDLEVEHVWKRVWQVACLEQDIPSVGDFMLYDIAGISIIVTRSAPAQFSAFYNACLHRGTELKACSGTVKEFRCPFHGWGYDLEGRLADVPAAWDFPHVQIGKERLPKVQVDTWDGWVFINLDPNCEPLAKHLGILPDHFKYWPWKDRYKAAHVVKVVPCNWKVALEAFIESYHVPVVHPQITKITSSFQTQYDILGAHVSRMLAASAAPNPFTGPDISEQELADLYSEATGKPRMVVPEGMTARATIANRSRTQGGGLFGISKARAGASDVEILDSSEYYLFPNFVPWSSYGTPMAYRYRPYGNDPHRSIMEFWLLKPSDPDDDTPPVETRRLGDIETFADAPELGAIGPAYDQDLDNLPKIQQGLLTMEASGQKGLKLSQYQESRIRKLHETLTHYVEG